MLKAVGQVLFSTGYQSPKFTPEESKGQDYEVRTYHATTWVSTTVSEMEEEAALSTGFRRLFSYIQGKNQSKAKVEMTAPVTCLMDPGAGQSPGTFTVSFFLPEKHQAEPPQPTDPEIFCENRKEFTAYVRTFGGFANPQMRQEERLKLLECLQRDGVLFQDQPYYTAGYDSPLKLTNRQNEVWVIKKTGQ